ncbi:unnamed protein product [Cuscuta campestris]|uniref:BZIP domain-containing protein n=2 Tax=Cuscuta sect. Cleistogrammica TaxID=1824901 RepID=A0A484L8B8_9ASTE|nr:hypothetical protein DM860_015188 [Cuscuta australis]WGN96256.1 FD-like protein [Cuscuta campestris]VFQ72546.1 unnamed protein product [Cuscuta campestris]
MGSYLNFKGENPLTRQPSIYSLTFEELQSSYGGLGKDFGSVNMEDLLKNIWTAEEESQAFASAEAATVPCGNFLQRQVSLTLPRTLSQRTVGEVWKDFQKEAVSKNYGEITLEEFLVKAGVVTEDKEPTGGTLQERPQLPLYSNKQPTAAFVSLGHPLSSDVVAKRNLDASSLSPSPYVFNEGGRGRRGCSSLDKVVERRRKRMIKNRESAARSRARKQAYTLELEAEVAKQKEINAQLRKKQAELLEMQKKQQEEKEKRGHQSCKSMCLRRTQTGPV